MAEDPPAAEPSGTVFAPTPTAPGAAPLVPPASTGWVAPATAPPQPTPPPQASVFSPAPLPPGQAGRVEVGSVLNNIYSVTRLIGRGGMGEVWEGMNLAGEEKVAIKVMLPSLAADQMVQEMFRKEARILTRLQHPALVQYRVLALEPTLGVLYIVTEFIDGPPLSEQLATLHADGAQLKALTRRLAQGLGAAHELGAVHRDMSPDNVLLPEGRLERAKVIDFGIAKDLDPTKKTIVGDGFAGKLGYVAPEQFGDYGREIGPWTDVYSLGLVILAAALGKNVDMGATLVDAIDRRRAGPDLSPLPPELRPVLGQMLQADPAKRLRSMEAVIAALDAPAPSPPTSSPLNEGRTTSEPPGVKTAAPQVAAAAAKTEPPRPPRKGLPMPAMMGGGAVAVLAVGGALFLLIPKPSKPSGQSAPAVPAPTVAAPSPASADAGLPPGERARRAIEAAFPKIGCTWLDLTDIAAQGGAVSLKLAGVAGSPVAAQTAVTNAASGAGVRVADVSLQEVAPVETPVCAALDAFRGVRADTSQAGRRLSSAQRTFVMTKQEGGKFAARAVITMALGDAKLDFALVGLDPAGKIDPIIPSRRAMTVDGQIITGLGNDSYRLLIDTDHRGVAGLLLLTGKGPFDSKLITGPGADRGPDWPARFKAAADKGGWKAEMVWYKTVAN